MAALISARRVRSYPKRIAKMTRSLRRGNIERAKFRQPRPRRHARTWHLRTGFDQQAALEGRAADSVRGSLQERIVYQALVDFGFMPGVDFSFQTSQLGGRREIGGLVADFIFETPRVILQVQSIWHTLTTELERRDDEQRLVLESMGWTVLDLWPNTIEDQSALDQWIDKHIVGLFGRSSTGLIGGVSGVDSHRDISAGVYQRIEATLDQIIFRLEQ